MKKIFENEYVRKLKKKFQNLMNLEIVLKKYYIKIEK